MANCQSTNFDIAISGQVAPYLVRATYGPLAAESYLEVDSRDPEWRRRLGELTPNGAPPGAALLVDTGVRLFQVLFRDRVRDLWLRAQADLASARVAAVRLRLSLTPPAVAALPWEGIQDPDSLTPVAIKAQTSIVRVANLLGNVGRVRSLVTTLPLRILAVLPEDPSGQIDSAGEWVTLQTALNPLAPDGINLQVVRGQVELLALRQALTAQQPHIVHIVTHGQPDGLLFWAAGQPMLATAQALCTALDEASALSLVLLNACASGQTWPTGDNSTQLTAVGPQLLQTGLPALIAMQFAVGATAARRFGEVFYQELLTGRCPGQLDSAMSAARSSLYLTDQATFGYGTPVLWLNAPDGRIFAADHPLQLRPALAIAVPPTPAALEAQVAAVRVWLAAQPSAASAPSTAQLRSLLAQRQEKVRWVQDRLGQIPVQPSTTDSLDSALAILDEIRTHMRAADKLTLIIQSNQG